MGESITIAITGMNATDNPGPGVAVVRSLRASSRFRSCRIIALCYGPLEPGVYIEGLVDKSYLLPYPGMGNTALFEAICAIQQTEHIDVLVPNLDAELFAFITLSEKLQSLGIGMFLPTMEQFERRQKSVLPELSSLIGVSVPSSLCCFEVGEFLSEGREEYPVFVKGRFYDAVCVHNREQFYAAFNKMSLAWGYPVIVQRFVDGVEYNLVGFGDGNGALLSAVSMRKSVLTEKGKAWAGVTVMDEELMEIARSFVAKTSWRGPFELEMIKSREGVFHLIEVNPRMPAWVYLSTESGQNIPELTVCAALGEMGTPNLDYAVGKMFVRYSWDLVVDQSVFASFSIKGEM